MKRNLGKKWAAPETMGLMNADGGGFLAMWTDKNGELTLLRDTCCIDRFDALVCLLDFVVEYECERRGCPKREWGWVYENPRSRFTRPCGFNPLDEIFVDGRMEELLRTRYELVGYDVPLCAN